MVRPLRCGVRGAEVAATVGGRGPAACPVAAVELSDDGRPRACRGRGVLAAGGDPSSWRDAPSSQRARPPALH